VRQHGRPAKPQPKQVEHPAKLRQQHVLERSRAAGGRAEVDQRPTPRRSYRAWRRSMTAWL
jgi:hypothetical protein